MTLKAILISLVSLLTISKAYAQDHNIVGHYYSYITAEQQSVKLHIAENLKHSNTLKDCQPTLKKIMDSLAEIEFDTEKQNLFQVTYSNYINNDSTTAVLNVCEVNISGQGVSFKKIETDKYSAESRYKYLTEEDPETLRKVYAIRSDSSKRTINFFQTKNAGLFGLKLKLQYVDVTVD